MSTSAIIDTLWECIDMKNLSDEQLESLCRFDGQSSELSNLADVMDELACLISSDGNRGSNISGEFQDGESVSKLLWVLAQAVKTSASVCFVMSEANALLSHRREMSSPKSQTQERKANSTR